MSSRTSRKPRLGAVVAPGFYMIGGMVGVGAWSDEGIVAMAAVGFAWLVAGLFSAYLRVGHTYYDGRYDERHARREGPATTPPHPTHTTARSAELPRIEP